MGSSFACVNVIYVINKNRAQQILILLFSYCSVNGLRRVWIDDAGVAEVAVELSTAVVCVSSSALEVGIS
ncbi:MAG TPA: hypothetical protein VE573_09290, partial [Nitrososphaeraceae archaeon]|nr:hypothetical protein [Nitrososphaeraceae archaeon]